MTAAYAHEVWLPQVRHGATEVMVRNPINPLKFVIEVWFVQFLKISPQPRTPIATTTKNFQASAIRGLFLSVIHRQKASYSTFSCSPVPASQRPNLHLSGDTVELKCRKRPVARGQSTDIAHGADNPRIRSTVFEFD